MEERERERVELYLYVDKSSTRSNRDNGMIVSFKWKENNTEKAIYIFFEGEKKQNIN